MKSLFNFVIYTLLFALLIPIPADATEYAVLIPIGAGAACAFLKYGDKINVPVLYNGIDVEVWKRYIIEKFRKTNSFIFDSKDDSSYVLGGAVVHIPQAGADPVIVKNRNSYPATAVRRTDNDITYPLDTYSTDPTHIPWAELQSISYDKIDSVLGNHVSALSETVADDLLIKWGPTGAQLIPTTGGSGGATQAGVGGQTGTRKVFHPDDLITAMIAMDNQNVPRAGRKCMIDTKMLGEFYKQLSATQMNAFQQYADNKRGVIGMLHGFEIYTRSGVLAYTSGGALKALGAAIAGTDNYASLCWHPNVVCRAMGDMKPFQDKDNPLYFGDIYSMIVRMGGRQERAGGEGIFAIVQAP